MKAKKHLGQNFLVDKNVQKKIVESVELGKSDIVFEIGSGAGQITDLLAAHASFVYALEIDRTLCGILEKKFKGRNNVRIINANILKFDLLGPEFNPGPGRVKIVGNIPYYITTPILEKILQWRKKIHSAFITVQKEFARRMVAVPGSKAYGSLSCFVQYYADARILFDIGKGCFSPAPKVDSCLLKLIMRTSPPVNVEEDTFFKIIRAAFNKRRKTLRNSLEGIVERDNLKLFFEKYGIDSNIRPEDLSLADFADLANVVSRTGTGLILSPSMEKRRKKRKKRLTK